MSFWHTLNLVAFSLQIGAVITLVIKWYGERLGLFPSDPTMTWVLRNIVHCCCVVFFVALYMSQAELESSESPVPVDVEHTSEDITDEASPEPSPL
jgi:hypothetical protein